MTGFHYFLCFIYCISLSLCRKLLTVTNTVDPDPGILKCNNNAELRKAVIQALHSINRNILQGVSGVPQNDVNCVSELMVRYSPYITQCKMDDPQLSKCILTAIEVIRPRFLEGIPEMKLPSVNPYHIDKVSVSTDRFLLEITNVSLIGLINVQVDDLSIDLDKNLVIAKASVPEIELQSNYNLSGNLMALAVQGSGYQDSFFSDVHYSMRMQGKREARKGKEYLTFDKIENQIEVGSGKFRFDDLFKGNPELTARTNEVINENSKALLNDMKKLGEETVGSIILSLFKAVFDTFSLDELFV